MKAVLKVVAVLFLSACASAPQAGGLVDVTVLDRTTGTPLPLYRHHGKLFVAGRPGDKYAVVLQNRSQARVLTVLSVDGVNAITGETAAVQQSGYVLAPQAQTEIAGWRKNMSEVAGFVFTVLPDSYAARTGRPDNVGVIGVAVFREQLPPPPASLSLTGRAASAPEADANGAARAKKQELGTGHGERERSDAQYTEFQRASREPAETIRIYYDSYANLVTAGVIPEHRPHTPDPFPARFVPDPA